MRNFFHRQWEVYETESGQVAHGVSFLGKQYPLRYWTKSSATSVARFFNTYGGYYEARKRNGQ